jgi:iron complex outermembrane receptor protein
MIGLVRNPFLLSLAKTKTMKILLGVLLSVLSIFCFGQASIEGTVKDEASNPVAGATIRLLNTAYTAYSNSKGEFAFTHLTESSYTIYVSSEGHGETFKTVSLQPGDNAVHITYPLKSGMLEAVVISSQKREEILQQSPLSVTALSAAKVEAYRLWNINDLTSISSNLYSSNPGDNRNVTSIRGIVNTSYDQAIATYVDGVNQFNLDTYIPQLFDVERIEILKGPQGTLYGRNAMGGVINIITKKPGNITNGFAQVNIGNYGLQRYTAGVRTPVIKDKLFFGAAGLFDKTNGFYTNDLNNSDYDKRSSAIGNYYLRFLPNSQWSITLNAKNAYNRNRGAFPLVFGVDDAFKNPFHLNQNATTKMIDNVFNASLSLNHYGRTVQLSSQTAYQSNHRYYTDPIDADFSPLDAMSIINNYGDKWNNVKTWTQEINLQSPATKSGKIKWLVGTYLFYQDVPVKQTTRYGEQAQLLGAPDKNFSTINTSKGKGTGAAVYGDLRFSLSKNLSLTAGLRYDHETRKQQVLGEYQKDPDPNPMFAFRSDTSAKANFSALSPKLTLAFSPSQEQTLYVAYNRGFRAGGLTGLSSDPSQPALYSFKPEFSNNIEAGWKQSWFDQKLFFNLALFHATISDVQVPTLVLPDAVTITRNTGKLTSKGVEGELRSLLSKHLSLDYSIGYTDAQYDRLKVSQNGSEADLKGKRQLFTPEFTSLLAAQFMHPLGNHVSISLRGEWRYIGTTYFDLANTIKQSPHNLINARLALAYKKAELSFWGRNLTDKHYIGYAYDFGAVHLGDPRTYGIGLGVKF